MQNLNNIFQSQQLLSSVNNDICKLKLIHKVWFKLIERTLNNGTPTAFNPQILEQCLPISVRKEVLNLGCESSLIANHIRFIEQALIQEILDRGINGITRLNISVMPQEIQQSNEELNQPIIRNVDQRTINTLKDFTRSCSSEKLRSSTERLLIQLQKNKI